MHIRDPPWKTTHTVFWNWAPFRIVDTRFEMMEIHVENNLILVEKFCIYINLFELHKLFGHILLRESVEESRTNVLLRLP